MDAPLLALLFPHLADLEVALVGRTAARLARVLGVTRSRHTFLRAIRAVPDPEPPEALPVIGIDDFAFRKRHTYLTVIVDQTTGRVLDVLPYRQAETVAAWLSRASRSSAATVPRPTGPPSPPPSPRPSK